MKKHFRITALSLSLFLMMSASAHAHILWLTTNDSSPEPGEAVEITIGFGHAFPDGVIEKEGLMQDVYVVGPDGNRIDCTPVSPSTYTFTPPAKGTYWLFAARNPGFVSNTTKGRKLGSKKTLKNVTACDAFRMSAMTSIQCGSSSWNQAGPGAFDLEIVPAEDPSGVKKGDTLSVKVLFQGKPLPGASVTPAPAEAGKDKHPEAVETDADGIARIQLTAGGSWLFTARHKEPYPDQGECDNFSYSTSLTCDF